jgi:hypothetical protein
MIRNHEESLKRNELSDAMQSNIEDKKHYRSKSQENIDKNENNALNNSLPILNLSKTSSVPSLKLGNNDIRNKDTIAKNLYEKDLNDSKENLFGCQDEQKSLNISVLDNSMMNAGKGNANQSSIVNDANEKNKPFSLSVNCSFQ